MVSIWRNAFVYPATLVGETIRDAAIAVKDGRFIFVGPERYLPSNLKQSANLIDCGGRWITPALVDCHTHLIFGGNRAMELEMRLAGATYEEVARASGGIVSSVKAINALSVEGLVQAPGMELAHAEGLVDAVDGFCEGIVFSVDEMRIVFDKAKSLGIPEKLHAEQLSNLGGAKMAASYGALSAEHVEYLDSEGATDCNPGTSPLTSLLLTMNMAATLFRLTVDECIAGATREAARALGLLTETGTLEAGKSADFVVWNIERPAELVYRIGFNPLHSRIFKGQQVQI